MYYNAIITFDTSFSMRWSAITSVAGEHQPLFEEMTTYNANFGVSFWKGKRLQQLWQLPLATNFKNFAQPKTRHPSQCVIVVSNRNNLPQLFQHHHHRSWWVLLVLQSPHLPSALTQNPMDRSAYMHRQTNITHIIYPSRNFLSWIRDQKSCGKMGIA